MSQPLDLLLIHSPKTNDFLEPAGEATFINIIPTGLFVMADYLDKKGHRVRILHLGIHRHQHGSWDPCSYIARMKPGIVAFSLFWHHQSYDVINTAGKIRRQFPCIPILVGGLTGACFAREILRDYPFIDGVITGDGEEALDMILTMVNRNKIKTHDDFSHTDNDSSRTFPFTGFIDQIPREELDDIPGLILRWRDQLLCTGEAGPVTLEILNNGDDSRLDLLEDSFLYPKFSSLPSIMFQGKSLPAWGISMERDEGIFFPRLGRGCSRQCVWCGRQKGSSVAFRKADRVISSVVQAQKKGFRSVYITHDPCSDAEFYYRELFFLMRKEMNCREMELYFECWGLPRREFIDLFADTFPRGIMGLSPDTGDEDLRRRYKGSSYDDTHLFEAVDYMENRRLGYDLFFSAGLPGENREMFQKTRNMITKFRHRGKYLDQIILQSIQLEPGSPWFEDPKFFNIQARYRGFSDYVKAHGPGGRGSFTSLGYVIPGYFPGIRRGHSLEDFEDRILQMRKDAGFLPLGLMDQDHPSADLLPAMKSRRIKKSEQV